MKSRWPEGKTFIRAQRRICQTISPFVAASLWRVHRLGFSFFFFALDGSVSSCLRNGILPPVLPRQRPSFSRSEKLNFEGDAVSDGGARAVGPLARRKHLLDGRASTWRRPKWDLLLILETKRKK